MRIGSETDPFVAEILPNGNLEIRLRGQQVLALPEETESDDIQMLDELLRLTEWPEGVELYNTSRKSKRLLVPGFDYLPRISDAIRQDFFEKENWHPSPGCKSWTWPDGLDSRLIQALERDKKLTFTLSQ